VKALKGLKRRPRQFACGNARNRQLGGHAHELLTDYERRLPPELYARFLEHYRERLFAELPDECPFFFPFKRILARASR